MTRKCLALVRKQQKDILWEAQKGLCYLCKKEMLRNKTTIDHVIPRSKKGADDLRNYRLAHSHCNNQKADMAIEDFQGIQELDNLPGFKEWREQ